MWENHVRAGQLAAAIAVGAAVRVAVQCPMSFLLKSTRLVSHGVHAEASSRRVLRTVQTRRAVVPAIPEVAPADMVPLLRRVAAATNRSVRAARGLVAKGRVVVDGHRCDDQLALVGASSRVIVLCRNGDVVAGGRGIQEIEAPQPREFYLKFFKPRGVICSHRPEKLSKRPIISSFYPRGTEDILHCAGRLDRDSEGLILLTSDGSFSRFATMPEAHCEKEYLAVTNCARDRSPPPDALLQKLCDGVLLPDGEAQALVAEVVDFDGRLARIRLVVQEGRFHMVRRMLRAIGYSCLQLLRTRIGNIGGMVVRPDTLAEVLAEADSSPTIAPAVEGHSSALRPGEFAALAPEELENVYRLGLPWLEKYHPV